MIDRTETQWYRDAIIYQLHVKSFFDSTNDGVGDFVGVTEKLDYIKELGATAIWVMPFYPSPLRDDGYDIADYRGHQPVLRDHAKDFPRLRGGGARAGPAGDHRVGDQPHVSDQHPWFQRARTAKKPPGSAASATSTSGRTPTRRMKDTRIIFLDTEASNWTWDEQVAKQYLLAPVLLATSRT